MNQRLDREESHMSQTPPSGRKEGNISAWDVISTNQAPIQLDHQLVADLCNTILYFINKYGETAWSDLISSFYTHIVTTGNPHNLTVDDFDTTVLDVVYSQWLNEGYTGSMQDFIAVFFQNVDTLDLSGYDDIAAGLADDKLPVVAVIHRFLKEHDEAMQVHEEALGPFIVKERVVNFGKPPIFGISKLTRFGVPTSYRDYVDGYHFRDYPVDSWWLGSYYLHLRFPTVIGVNDPPYSWGNFGIYPTNVNIGDTIDIDADFRYLGVRHSTLGTFIDCGYNNSGVAAIHTVNAFPLVEEGSFVNVGIQVDLEGNYTCYHSHTDVSIKVSGPSGVPTSIENQVLGCHNLTKPHASLMPDDYPTDGVFLFAGNFTDFEIRDHLQSFWTIPDN